MNSKILILRERFPGIRSAISPYVHMRRLPSQVNGARFRNSSMCVYIILNCSSATATGKPVLVYPSFLRILSGIVERSLLKGQGLFQ